MRWFLKVVAAAVLILCCASAQSDAAVAPIAEPRTCEEWLRLTAAPNGYVGRPYLWAACQHARLVSSLAPDPERLVQFLALERDLTTMCDALVELGSARSNGGNWVLHEQPRTRGEISRDLFSISELMDRGSGRSIGDAERIELAGLRKRVVDRIRTPEPGGMYPIGGLTSSDSTSYTGEWRKYSVGYLDAAQRVASYHFLLGQDDRAALDLMRLADRMLRLYVDQDFRSRSR